MNLLERIDEREKQLSELRRRQDADRDLLYLKKYIMLDSDNKPIKDIINVTLNRPAVFAKNVIAAMGTTTQQIIVESSDPMFDTHYVESFLKTAIRAANLRLRRLGRFQLNPFFDEQICIRGMPAARCVFQMKNGVLVPDISYWDTRYFTWEMGENGLEYGGYTCNRTQEAIRSQYGIKIKGDKGKVVDVWDKEHNEVWIDEKLEFEQRHNFGYTPIVMGIVPSGSMLQDEDALSHYGESIFSLIREAIPELNRLVSIMQTLNLKAVKPPMKAKKQGGGVAPKYEDVTGMGTTTAMDINEDILPIDYGDAKRAAEMAYGILDKSLQEGSLNAFDMGTFDQAMSAIALVQIGEGRDQVFAPILDTKALLNEDLSTMIINQVNQLGGKIELGEEGHKSSWDTRKLKGEYTVTYHYFPKSPKIDAARFSMAASVGDGLISKRAKRIEILQREDWEEDERQLAWEEAEMISPVVKINRVIRSLVEMADRGDDTTLFEAELLSAEMGVSLDMMLQGQGGNAPTVQKEKGQQMMPVFPTSQQTAGKEASDLGRTPEGFV